MAVGAADGFYRFGADLSIGPVSVDAQLRGRVAAGNTASSTVSGTVDVHETDLPAVLETLRAIGLDAASGAEIGSGGLTAGAQVSGTLAAPRVVMSAAVRDLEIGGWTGLDADLEAEGDIARLEVKSHVRHRGTNAADAAGVVWPAERRIDLDVSATAPDIAGFLAGMTGRAQLRMRAAGPVHALTLRGTATLADAGYRGVPLGRVDATLDADPMVAYVDIGFPRIAAQAQTVIDRMTRQASIELRVANASLATVLRDAGVAANVTGTLDVLGRATVPIDDWRSGVAAMEVTRLDARAGELPIRLAEPAHVAYEAGRITISRLEAEVAETRLSVRGGLPVASSPTSTPDADALRAVLTGDLAHILAAAQTSGVLDVPGLAGRGALAVLAQVTGSVERPEIAANVELSSGELTYGAMPPVRSVQLRGRVAAGRIDLISAAAEWQQSRLRANAQLPLALLQSYVPFGIATTDGAAATVVTRGVSHRSDAM